MRIEIRKLDEEIIIENGTYTNEVHYYGSDKLPDLGVDYIYAQWADMAWYDCYYVDLNNHIQALTPEMNELLLSTTTSWVQPLGQEGNPNDEQKLIIIKNGIQTHIDTKAVELGFDNINSISKYMGFDNPYRTDAESLALWTANVWVYVEAELVKMESGTRTIPTVDEAILELPTF